jgi:hypothetical protein
MIGGSLSVGGFGEAAREHLEHELRLGEKLAATGFITTANRARRGQSR